MSKENVEIVRSAFSAWNAGDMDRVREAFDPDVIMRMVDGWPEPGPFVGRDAVMRQLEQQRETWDTDSFELISDFIDAGERVGVRWIWHGAGSGPEANIEATAVYTVRKRMIFYIEHFWDHAEALQAVGLGEQGAHFTPPPTAVCRVALTSVVRRCPARGGGHDRGADFVPTQEVSSHVRHPRENHALDSRGHVP